MNIESIKELLTPTYLGDILVLDVEGNLQRRLIRKEYTNFREVDDKLLVVKDNNADAIISQDDATVYLNDAQRDSLKAAILELKEFTNKAEDILQINEAYAMSLDDICHDN